MTATTYEYPDSQTLASHARLFLRYTPPRLIILALTAAVVYRATLGGWGWRDLLGPVIITALEPFAEWAIHIVLLHFRPRAIAGRIVDPYVARKHREHHQAPRRVSLVLLPTRVVSIMLPTAAIIAVALGQGKPSSYTTLAFAYLMLLIYEWTHFLIHSKYRPRRWYYKTIWRNHRNHHFRNEHYWFGVTSDVGDRLLRTAPERDAVPVSPTAKDLAAGWS
ncbi:MAG TPA: sterol desaturase family protein [Acidimicrobiales bacterium]|nr:sterol desaturase family protein [Acidimicrobiales bacterium]